MKTMHIGGTLLVTAAMAWNALHLPAHSAGKSASAAPSQRVSQKTILLSIEGMH